MEPFIAEIRMVGFNFAPRGWAFCDGTLLPIAQNTALFALLGTTYGGDGRTTFALPDLRGRAPMHPGQAPGLSSYQLGEQTGSESVTLTVVEMPAHTHGAGGSGQAVHVSTAAVGAPAPDVAPAQVMSSAYGPPTSLVAMNDQAGGGLPHQNRQPYLCTPFIIALQGIFPSRP